MYTRAHTEVKLTLRGRRAAPDRALRSDRAAGCRLPAQVGAEQLGKTLLEKNLQHRVWSRQIEVVVDGFLDGEAIQDGDDQIREAKKRVVVDLSVRSSVLGPQPLQLGLTVEIVDRGHAALQLFTAQRVGQHVEEDPERRPGADGPETLHELGQQIVAGHRTHDRRDPGQLVAEVRIDQRRDQARFVPEVATRPWPSSRRIPRRWPSGSAR